MVTTSYVSKTRRRAKAIEVDIAIEVARAHLRTALIPLAHPQLQANNLPDHSNLLAGMNVSNKALETVVNECQNG